MKTNMSYHTRVERQKRIELIIDLLGIGNITVIDDDTKDPLCEACLTTTGICIIRRKDNKKIVTTYVPSIGQVRKMYQHKYGFTDIPHGMFEIVRGNQKYANKINCADA